MVDSRLAFDIMARDDGATAVLSKVERALDKTGNAAQRNSKISEKAAAASANLTKAHNAESNALDKVQVAEQRLSEVRGNSKSKTSQVLAAEKALAKARREAAIAGDVAQKATKELSAALDNEGKKAGKGFSANLKKWLTGGGGMKEAGQTGGTVFGSGFLGVIKTPILGPAVVAAISAAVVTALPAVGAVAASALVVGFGAGLAGLGIVFAAKSVAVKNAWNRTLWSMAADMKIFSKPFESTLVSVAGIANRTFAKFAPSLQENFKEIAPAVTKFADDLGRGFERLQPAIRPLSEAFAAVLGSLGPAMQSALGSISAGLVTLSESVKRNPAGLSDMVTGVGSLTQKLLDGISALNNFNGAIERFTHGTSAVDLVFGSANSKVAQFVGIVTRAVNPLGGVKAGFDAVIGSADKTSGAVGLTGNAMNMYTQGLNAAQVKALLAGKSLDQLGGAATRSAHETHAANAAALLLAGAFDRQAAATQHSIDALNRRSNLLLALSGSEIAYQQAVDDATAAIKENGKTHDINTQKGRDNVTALNQVATSAIAQRDAMLKANDGNVKAAKAAETGRAAYIKLAQQMGYSKTQATAMAAQFIKIPNVTRTAKLQANIADLQSKLAVAKRYLNDHDLTKERRAKLNADITQWQAKIATAKKQLNDPNLTKERKAKLNAEIAALQAKVATAKGLLNNKELTKERKAKLLADISRLQAGIAAAKGALASVPGSKTVTITTRMVTERIIRTQTTATTGGHAPGEPRASGGPVKKGQPYWVGEKGPEPFIPDQNGTIIPNNAVKKSGAMGVGSAVVAGLAQGAAGNAASAYSAVAEVAAGMIAKARSVLGISSPSKAFAQLGLYITQGFRAGLMGSAKSVQSAMASLMGKVLNIAFNAADTKKSIQKTITSLNAALASARGKIKPITHGMSKAEVAAAERSNRAVSASIRSLQARLNTAKIDLSNVNSIASRLGTTKKRSAVLAMIQRENVAMQKLANARAVVANNLKAAQARLAGAIEVRDEFKKAITDSAMAFNAITNIQAPEGGKLTASGIIAQMTETLRRTQQFAANLARLKKSGLNATTYKQIAEAGVEQGGSIADALLSGGGNTFNSINRLQSNINSAATGLGTVAAKNLYQAGVDAAQGLVNGLLAKTKALDAASKKLAAAIVAQIKKTLGIRSPSKVLEWHGSMAGRGFERGILGEYGRVQKAGAGLGNTALPGSSSRGVTRQGGGGTVVNNYYITVTGVGDKIGAAKEIQQLLLNLKRTNRIELGIA